MSKARTEKYKYQSGFGNEFATEAIPNSLPVGQNSPQKCPYGLYAEQLSGSAFTAPRQPGGMARSWLYRVLPSPAHEPFEKIGKGLFSPHDNDFEPTPNQMRWKPVDLPAEGKSVDFIEGLITFCGAGSPDLKTGCQVHYYSCNKDMVDKALYNSDGEFLIVPQQGRLDIKTELGMLEVFPGEIVVIPRGILFAVSLPDGPSRGYICELFQGRYILPNLGPIGSNCLANPRDFLYPVAAYEDRDVEFTVVNKFIGELFQCKRKNSPFNVVAWHGNYAPYKYDLDRFCCINSVTFDHPDPSIYCVLTAPGTVDGVAVIDFVIFPPRWEAKDHTFRPPYFHRNCMSEFMGLIRGAYEAKKEGFTPGSSSLHSCMTPHGPDVHTFEAASNADISKPIKLGDTMAFMFESSYLLKLSKWAREKNNIDNDYYKCWQGFKNYHRESIK